MSKSWYRDGYGEVRFGIVVAGVIVGVIAGIALLMTGICYGIARPVDHASCMGYGKATGLRVKFVDYAFGSWDCLEYVHGHWQPQGNDVSVNPR